MKNKYLTTVLISFLAMHNVALADTFNYSSRSECEDAMENYQQKADELSKSASDFHESMAFMRMGGFFYNMANNPGGTDVRCINNVCTYTTTADCRTLMETSESRTAWATVVAPLLAKEVNYLQSQTPDSDVPRSAFVNCSYQKDAPVNWNSCQLKVVT